MQCILRSIIPAASPLRGRDIRIKIAARRSARVHTRRDAMPRIVDARGDPVAAIGLHRRAAAAETRQEDDGAKG